MGQVAWNKKDDDDCTLFCREGERDWDEGQAESDSDAVSSAARGRAWLHRAAEFADQQKHFDSTTGQEHIGQSAVTVLYIYT